MVAGREGVDVETLADPRLARVSHEPRLGGAHILHGRHLEVGGIAFEHIGRRARPFGDRNVVGEIDDAGGRRAPMGRQDEGKANACGVCTARRLARGGVASTRPSGSTCLTVSLIGVPGAAAPWRLAA